MAIKTKNVPLSSEYCMPVIGLGTSMSQTGDDPDPIEAENFVKTALKLGYHHIDCVPVYDNEVAVSKGIKGSGIAREELFNTERYPADVAPALEKSLKDLGLDYVHLYLIQWPQAYVKQTPYTPYPADTNGKTLTANIPLASPWAAMEALVAAGKARSIGVSNFSQELLEEILSSAKISPAVNQIPATPFCPKTDRLEWCQSKNIHLTAWGPLTIARGSQNVASDPTTQKIAKELGSTAAQLCLSWVVQRGTSVIPKSASESRLRENLEVVELSNETMALIEKLEIIA